MDIGCDGLHNLMDRLEQLEADGNCTCSTAMCSVTGILFVVYHVQCKQY